MLRIAAKKHQTEKNVSVKNHAVIAKERNRTTPNMLMILWLDTRQLPQVATRYRNSVRYTYRCGE